jgi:hypothetical protein
MAGNPKCDRNTGHYPIPGAYFFDPKIHTITNFKECHYCNYPKPWGGDIKPRMFLGWECGHSSCSFCLRNMLKEYTVKMIGRTKDGSYGLTCKACRSLTNPGSNENHVVSLNRLALKIIFKPDYDKLEPLIASSMLKIENGARHCTKFKCNNVLFVDKSIPYQFCNSCTSKICTNCWSDDNNCVCRRAQNPHNMGTVTMVETTTSYHRTAFLPIFECQNRKPIILEKPLLTAPRQVEYTIAKSSSVQVKIVYGGETFRISTATFFDDTIQDIKKRFLQNLKEKNMQTTPNLKSLLVENLDFFLSGKALSSSSLASNYQLNISTEILCIVI